MKCINCGSELEPNESFCFNCGAKVQGNNEINKVEAEPVKVDPPIIPEAPEAPLPGTQPIPIVNLETPAQTVNVVSNEAQSVNVAQNVSNETQPAITNNDNQMAPDSSKKKSSPVAIIIIVVLAIVAIVLLFILLKDTFNTSPNGKEGNNSNLTSPTTASTTTTTKPVVEQIINGVKIVIPDGWKYYPTTLEIVGSVMNPSLGTQLNIYPMSNVKYADYVNNQAAIQQSLTNNGIIVNSSLVIPENQSQFFGFTVTANGVDELMYFTSMPDGSMMRFEVVKNDISLEDTFKLMTSIASSAKTITE